MLCEVHLYLDLCHAARLPVDPPEGQPWNGGQLTSQTRVPEVASMQPLTVLMSLRNAELTKRSASQLRLFGARSNQQSALSETVVSALQG